MQGYCSVIANAKQANVACYISICQDIFSLITVAYYMGTFKSVLHVYV